VSTIGERLRSAREALGLTQAEVADKAGVRQGTIGNIEADLRQAPRELLAIAAAVNLSPDYLKTGRGPKHPTQVLRLGGNGPFAAEPAKPYTNEHLPLEQALAVVLEALGVLTQGQWAMVRARLDALPEHPEAAADVAADVLPLLQPRPGKRLAAG
jgi:transcriptional regulator with XRE-family HTH domain